MAALLKVTARPGLLSSQFRHGPIHVRQGIWTDVDADDPEVRSILLAYVPSHVRIAHGQDRELQAAGLEPKGGHLIDVRAEKAKAAASSPPAPAPAPVPTTTTKEKAPRAEK